jgi:tRNA(Ile)-lysidine synthase
MFKRNDKVLVCISGGFDSTALLLLLYDLRKELLIDIHSAHLNHALRGKESNEDEKFVKRLATSLKLPLTCGHLPVGKLAEKKKSSLEDTARELRYNFFFDVARQIKAKKIVLGHTKDDQAETFLMHILRGSGPAGLSGIWPVRKRQGYTLVRPLIETTKKEVLDYLGEKNIRARLDSSNLKDIYFRNKIRLKLLPFLEREFNPNVKEVLAKESDTLREVYKFFKKRAERIFKKSVKVKKRVVELDLKSLDRKDVATRDELLRKCIYEAKGNLNRITFGHILNLNRMIKESSGTTTVDLPTIQVRKEYSKLKFYKKRRKVNESIELPKRIFIPGVTDISGLGLRIEAKFTSKAGYRPGEKEIEYVDFDKIREPVVLRFRKSGDKFKPLGMREEKKLKDFFIDNKIPKNKRDKTLLAVSSGEIIWVVGHRISETVKVRPKTKKMLKLKLTDTP